MPGYFSEGVAVKSVHADIEMCQPGRDPVVDMTRKVPAIGGESNLADAWLARGARDQLTDVFANGWLPACEADLGDTEPCKGADQARDLVSGEEIHGARFCVTVRQAVGAAEVAHFRHRKSQVTKPASECVRRSCAGRYHREAPFQEREAAGFPLTTRGRSALTVRDIETF